MKNTHPEYQYLNLLKDILEHGYRKVDRGTGDVSYSVFGRQIRFDLSRGFPLLTTKKVYWKAVLYELAWFVSGQSNIKYLIDHDVHIWDDYPYKIYNLKSQIANRKNIFNKDQFIEKIKTDEKFAKKWGELPKIYGELWRHWPTKTKRTIDQLKWAINEIVEDPNCHNAIVTSWNPEYLYTMARYQDTSHFPICHNLYQLNVIKGRVSIHLYHRSADLFLGVPFNIASYALLTHIIAKVAGYQPGEFIHSFGDVHIYEDHLKQVKEQLRRKPRPFPRLKFIKDFKTIDGFRPEYVVIEDYNPHPPIKASLSVSGGYFNQGQNQPRRLVFGSAEQAKSNQKISIIAAMGKRGELGKNNRLLWHIPEDLKRFKQLTKGHVVIMGRKTYESIGRPLPDRTNIIITREKKYQARTGDVSTHRKEKVIICHSLKEAIKLAKKIEKNEVFIIGGGEIYRQAIGLANKLYLTIVEGQFSADTFFPDYADFKKVIFEKTGESGGYKYKFIELVRHAKFSR